MVFFIFMVLQTHPLPLHHLHHLPHLILPHRLLHLHPHHHHRRHHLLPHFQILVYFFEQLGFLPLLHLLRIHRHHRPPLHCNIHLPHLHFRHLPVIWIIKINWINLHLNLHILFLGPFYPYYLVFLILRTFQIFFLYNWVFK